jgi:hypothetical protein
MTIVVASTAGVVLSAWKEIRILTIVCLRHIGSLIRIACMTSSLNRLLLLLLITTIIVGLWSYGVMRLISSVGLASTALFQSCLLILMLVVGVCVVGEGAWSSNRLLLLLMRLFLNDVSHLLALLWSVLLLLTYILGLRCKLDRRLLLKLIWCLSLAN